MKIDPYNRRNKEEPCINCYYRHSAYEKSRKAGGMTLEDAIVYYSETAKECRRKARIESKK